MWCTICRDDGSRQHLTTDSTKEHHDSSGHRVVRQAVKDQSSEVREARKQVHILTLNIGPREVMSRMASDVKFFSLFKRQRTGA